MTTTDPRIESYRAAAAKLGEALAYTGISPNGAAAIISEAEALGITQRRVQQMAHTRGVGREVGGSLVFTAVDIATLRKRPSVGRPRQGMSDFAARQLVELYHEQKRLGAGDPVSQAHRGIELATYYRQVGNEPEAAAWQALADQHTQTADTRLAAERAAQLLPVTTVNQNRTDRDDRVASTIRHNRARGKHQIQAMAEIVRDAAKRRRPDERIARELGMDLDEVLRYKQIGGFAELFADHEFSEAWEAVD